MKRRDFLRAAATAVPATLAGCTGKGSEHEEIDTFYLETDLDKLETEVNGNDLYVNLMSYAEDEDLENMRLEYREPGEEAWNVLEQQEAEKGESQISEPFHAETEGRYRFRSVAETGTENYVSETEEVEFVEDPGAEVF